MHTRLCWSCHHAHSLLLRGHALPLLDLGLVLRVAHQHRVRIIQVVAHRMQHYLVLVVGAERLVAIPASVRAFVCMFVSAYTQDGACERVCAPERTRARARENVCMHTHTCARLQAKAPGWL